MSRRKERFASPLIRPSGTFSPREKALTTTAFFHRNTVSKHSGKPEIQATTQRRRAKSKPRSSNALSLRERVWSLDVMGRYLEDPVFARRTLSLRERAG
jgi:hypothetical protein